MTTDAPKPIRGTPVPNLLTTDEHLKALVVAFEEFPILMRLEYVATLILNRACRDDESKEPELFAAKDILDDVIRVIMALPNADKIRNGPV